METSKGFYIITTAVGVGCIALGILAGVLIGTNVASKKYGDVYDGASWNNLEDDEEALWKKYSKTSKDAYFDTFTPEELVNIGYLNYKNHEFASQQLFGKVDAKGIKQIIRGATIKHGNKYFMESLSCSTMVKAAARYYENGENDNVDVYKGSFSTFKADDALIDIKWNSSKESSSKADHETEAGRNPSRPLIYIISNKTTLDTSKKEKDGSGYKITLDLDPELSTLRYGKQMTYISGVLNPTFKKMKIQYFLDSDLNITKTIANEEYSVVKVIKAESVGYIETYFSYDEVKIPEYNVNFNYSVREVA